MALDLNKEKSSPMSIKPLDEKDRPFSRINFYMMAGCVILIVLGFFLMSGGSSSVENGFNPDIFSIRRIVVGPLLSFLGFMLMAVARIWRPGYKGIKRKE